MNTAILKKYNINFNIVIEGQMKTLQVTSDVIPFLYGYFIKKYPEHYLKIFFLI